MAGNLKYASYGQELLLVPDNVADTHDYIRGIDAANAADARQYDPALDTPIEGINVIASDPDSPDHERVKQWSVDLAKESTEGAYFFDPEDPSIHYRLDNVGDRDVDFPEKVHADLEVIDNELGFRATYRVRMASSLRETSHVAWEFIGDQSRFVKAVGGIATGTAIGVMSLWAIRKRRKNS